mgnify:CR=1 FL=1
MKIWLCFLLFLGFACANAVSEKNLKENERIRAQLNKKLEDLAKDITSSEKNLKNLASQIQSASVEASKLEKGVKSYSQELVSLNVQNQNLLKDRNSMENKFVSLIAQDFAFDLSVPSGYAESDEGFIVYEILLSFDGVLKDELNKLSLDYKKNSKLIDEKQGKINEMNSNLKQYNAQLSKLEKLKQKQIEEIERQKVDRNIYTKKLEDLQKQQNEIRKTLADLNIVKKEQPKTSANSATNVKQLGSSYTGSLVKRYSGKKTIAPLESFTIKQRFGNFTDPIYNIKLFNENVILRSKSPDARVKSVFDGKIVFAKYTNLLQNVVIVEHSGGIHTIYAHLYQIAPTAKVGKRVKKGEVLGRVKNDLSFEVTQEKFHINPLELISLN